MQVDLNKLEYRDDRLSHSKWRKLRARFLDSAVNGKRGITKILEDCSKAGINVGSLVSPPNLLWELASFDTTTQLLVDEFHNLAEGHAQIFYAYFFDALSKDAQKLVQVVWNDPETWEPHASKSVSVV